MNTQRIGSLDILRGFAVMLILLFHSSIYNFANIHKLDFSNPPVVVVLISFMGLWGGIFILYSAAMNSYMLESRQSEGKNPSSFRFVYIAALVFVAIHFLLNLFLGRWNVDFVNNQPVLTAVAGVFRNGSFHLSEGKLFDGSSVGTIALNLIIITTILKIAYRRGKMTHSRRFYLLSGIAGTLIMLCSFVRVYLFPLYSQQVDQGHYLQGILLSFFFANPYPLLPYTAYALFGMIMGLMVVKSEKKLLIRSMLPVGLFFLVYGIAGMMQFDKTISKPDFFWYFKTNFELGVFILLFLLASFRPAPGGLAARWLSPVGWFSRVSLTIYLTEVTVSEIFRIAASGLVPGWNDTINGCLAFGAFNILFWLTVLIFWRKTGFRYSIEYFWVKLFEKAGKTSSKLNAF